MFRVTLLGATGLLLAAATLLAVQRPSARLRTEFVDLDAVVVDDDGRPVTGLHEEDFQLKEDGQRVTVSSFVEVSPLETIDRERPFRPSLLLLLDDTGMGPTATPVVQYIARAFVNRITVYGSIEPSVTVVRLTHRDDEPIAGREEVLKRIAQYQSGSYPFLSDTIESSLKRLAVLTRKMQPIEPGRKIVVGIGAPRIFDVALTEPPEYSILGPAWVDAVTSAARANVSLYVVDPAGSNSGFRLGPGLVEETGGLLYKSNDFTRGVDLIWAEASHYYLLGYTPISRSRTLHSIELTVKRPHMHVRARQSRGD
jgi:VWFA-related protein